MKEFVSHYRKDRVIPMIINLLKKENITVKESCVKVWERTHMLVNDVLRGISFAKEEGSEVIVYTNTVPHKEKLSEQYGVKILDIRDLRELSAKHSDWDLCDEL